MKSTFVIFTFLVMVLPCQASAQNGNIGVGVILDDPVSISVKRWLGKTTAIDGALALKSGGKDADSGAFDLHVDYLKHNFNLFRINEGSIPVHYGVGIKIENDKTMKTSIRVPVGISYQFQNTSVSVFYEFALLLDVSNSNLHSESALGVRYYF